MIREPVATKGPVLIIGSGLLGGSLGLSLRTRAVEVYLRDASPAVEALARDMGVGKIWRPDYEPPLLVIVATPPDVAANTVVAALKEFPEAIVCDVSSVKTTVISQVLTSGIPCSRYCSVHPMAGREIAGVSAAQADLFRARPWVVVAHDDSSEAAILAVRNLGVDVGSVISQMGPQEHDEAVALISHCPQLLSSLLAGLLQDANPSALALTGQGLRDMTRIAASDPRLWTAILAGNALPVRQVLSELRTHLDVLLDGLDKTERGGVFAHGSLGIINEVLHRGNLGAARIPGKHGVGVNKYGSVTVLVPDEPGFLGKLFSDAGQAGVNIEDFRLEHSLGQPQGLAIVYVIPSQVEVLSTYLEKLGWRIVLR